MNLYRKPIAPVLVYAPGGTAGGIVFTDWVGLVAAAMLFVGPLEIFVDGSNEAYAVTLPAGGYTFNGRTKIRSDKSNRTTLTCNGTTLTGVESFDDINVTNAGSAAIVTYTTGTPELTLDSVNLAGSSSAPVIECAGNSSPSIFASNSSIGDGTHAALSCGSGAFGLLGLEVDSSLPANGLGGTVANCLVIPFDASVSLDPSYLAEAFITPTGAALIGYDDTVATPASGAATVQAALDFLKRRVVQTAELTFQPGGTAAPGVFTTWASVVAAANLVQGQLIIYFDARFTVDQTCHIPVGAWAITTPGDVMWSGPWDNTFNAGFATVSFDQGATCTIPGRFRDLLVTSTSTSAPFVTDRSYFLRFEDCEFYGSGSGPIFHVSDGTTINIICVTGSFVGDDVHAVFFADTSGFVFIALGFGSYLAHLACTGTIANYSATLDDAASSVSTSLEFNHGLGGGAYAMYYVDDQLPAIGVDQAGTTQVSVQSALDVLKKNVAQLVYSPGGTAAGAVFTDFSKLVTAANAIGALGTPLTIYVDGSHVGYSVTLPAGAFTFTSPDVRLLGPWNTPANNDAGCTIIINTGTTLNGVATYENLTVISRSTAAVSTYGAGFAGLKLRGSFVYTDSGTPGAAPFYSLTSATSTLAFYLDAGGTIGDGTAASVTGVAGSAAQVTALQASTVDDNFATSTVAVTVNVFDSSVYVGPPYTPVLITQAFYDGYTDTKVTPASGKTNVQDAIDWLKQRPKRHTTAVTAATYATVATDNTLLVNRAGTVGVTLESVSVGRELTVVDASGAAGTAGHTITITAAAGQTINGASTASIAANWGVVKLLGVSATAWVTL